LTAPEPVSVGRQYRDAGAVDRYVATMLMKSDPLSTIQAFALFSAVIGVALGWVLSQFTEVFKWWLGRNRRIKAEQQARVLEYIRSADEIAATANGIGLAYAARADGTIPNNDQFMMMVNAFNDAFTNLERLRVESHLLGPDWLATEAVKVTNQLQQVQVGLRKAESGKTKKEFAALITEVDAYRAVREKLLATAKNRLS
jgi:hypothetical protein